MLSVLNDALMLILAAMTLSFTFLFIYYSEKMPYLIFWSTGWGLNAISIVFYTFPLIAPGMEGYEIVSLIINYISNVFIGLGIHHFIKGRLPSKKFIAAAVLVTLFPGVFFQDNIKLASMVVVYISGSTVFLFCGTSLIRNIKGLGSKVAGMAFIIWGIIMYFNVAAHKNPEITSELMRFNVLLTMVSALGILLMHFEKMRMELTGTTLVLKELTESSKDIVYSLRLKPEPVLDYISRSVYPLLGYSPEEISNNPNIFIKVLDEDRISDLKMTAEGKSIPNLQEIIELKTKDGSSMKFDVNQTIIYGMDGKPESVMGIARDVTKRSLEFDRLASEKTWYELIFKSSKIMTMLVEMHSMTITESNYAVNTFYCYPQDGMRGLHIRELFLDDNDYLDFLSSTDDGSPLRCIHKLPDKTTVHVTMHSSMLRYDEKSYTFITILDNTSENYLADELSKIKNLHRSILESLDEGVIGINSEGTVFFINNSAAEILGYETDELLYRNHHEAIHYKDETGEFPEEACSLLECLRTGETIRNKREFLVNKDGRLIPTLINFSSMRSQENRKMGVLVFRDITDDLNSEELILKSLEENRTLLKELHHRVKNNFQMICSLLALHADDLPDSAEKDFLNESVLKILSMALTHELLFETNSFSKLGSKSYFERMVNHLQRASHGAERSTVSTNIDDIDLTLDEAVPCALVINELFTNSIKYAQPDSGRLHIEIGFKQDGNEKVLSFSDNGQGIANIENFGGKGSYGLMIIRSLTRQLKGNISFENRNGLLVTLRFQ